MWQGDAEQHLKAAALRSSVPLAEPDILAISPPNDKLYLPTRSCKIHPVSAKQNIKTDKHAKATYGGIVNHTHWGRH
jgi:hypothetical protein